MRTKARLTETTHANSTSAYRSYHRQASTRLTAAITGEPQLGIPKLIIGKPELGLQKLITGEPELGLQKQHMRIPIRLTEAITGEPQLGLQQLSLASLTSAYRN